MAHGMTAAGYIYIPEDDTYTVNIDGFKKLWAWFGSDAFLDVDAHTLLNRETKTIKLRQGYHRISLAQTAHSISRTRPNAESLFWPRLAFTGSKGARL